MILFINDAGEIKDVGTTEREDLTRVELAEDGNPFDGWSTARLLCYRVEVRDGAVVMFTPYIDTRIVEQLDRQDETTTKQITETQVAVCDTFEATVMQAAETDAKVEKINGQFTEVQLALTEIFEMLSV